MKRRLALALGVGFALVGTIGVTGPSRAAAADKAKSPPHVLFILTDDQRFDTIHALGNDEIQTPHLDKLVQRGFSFGNVYCMGGLVPAVCTPSRTMLLTGKSLFHIPNNAS